MNEEIKELEKQKDAIQKKLDAFTDQFFIYGAVKQIEEIDRKIAKLKSDGI